MIIKNVAWLIVLIASFSISVNAQKKPVSPLCTRENALDTTKQQTLNTRTFDNVVQRIAVLLRAADLLWPHEQDKAMAAFMEAFDLAVQNFKEHGDQITRAPKTIVSTRALLALAYLYAKIDTNRGVEVLGNAVKTINVLESPDFSQQFVMMKIEGKTFGSYAAFSTPGFNPENAFREMGKLDFDGSLAQATSFNDKSLRALTTLSVIEPCLEVQPKSLRKGTKSTKP